MKDEIKNGVRQSLFRNTNQILDSKRTKQVWANIWYLTGDTYGTVSCPVNSGSMLKKIINHKVNNDGMDKLPIIEDGGKPILTGIKVKDVGCIFGDTDCMVDPKTPCDKTRAVYKITYNSYSEFLLTDNTDSSSYCKETYNHIGCTRSSIKSRIWVIKEGRKVNLTLTHCIDMIMTITVETHSNIPPP